MKTGILSDTHDLLRPEVITALQGCDLMIYGHSHQYAETWTDHTLLLNPGSCGPRRFHQPITLAVLETDGQGFHIRRIDIPHTAKETAPKIDPANVKAQIELVIRETGKAAGPRKSPGAPAWTPPSRNRSRACMSPIPASQRTAS